MPKKLNCFLEPRLSLNCICNILSFIIKLPVACAISSYIFSFIISLIFERKVLLQKIIGLMKYMLCGSGRSGSIPREK